MRHISEILTGTLQTLKTAFFSTNNFEEIEDNEIWTIHRNTDGHYFLINHISNTYSRIVPSDGGAFAIMVFGSGIGKIWPEEAVDLRHTLKGRELLTKGEKSENI